MSEKETELAERLRRHFAGPMSEQEIEFLRDVQSAIDFAIRNGLSFSMIASTLGHDFNTLAHAMFDFDAAKATGWLSKFKGYSKLTAEDFGESEEPAT